MGSAFSAPVINDVSTCLEGAPSYKNSQHAPELPENFKKVSTRRTDFSEAALVDLGAWRRTLLERRLEPRRREWWRQLLR